MIEIHPGGHIYTTAIGKHSKLELSSWRDHCSLSTSALFHITVNAQTKQIGSWAPQQQDTASGLQKSAFNHLLFFSLDGIIDLWPWKLGKSLMKFQPISS